MLNMLASMIVGIGIQGLVPRGSVSSAPSLEAMLYVSAEFLTFKLEIAQLALSS